MAVPTDRFQITRLRSADSVRVSVAGDLDLATAPTLHAQIEHEAQENPDVVLVIDLRNLNFIDSSGLHLLERAYEEHGNRLQIVLGHAAARLIEITAFATICRSSISRNRRTTAEQQTGGRSVIANRKRTNAWMGAPGAAQANGRADQ